jgi:hypothetical protein
MNCCWLMDASGTQQRSNQQELHPTSGSSDVTPTAR